MKSSSKPAQSNRKPVFNVSRVKTLIRCGRQYYYRYDYPREVFKKRGELVPSHPGLPLSKGSWMHELMRAHWLYTAGMGGGWEAEQQKLTDNFNRQFDEEKEIYGNLPNECDRLFKRYLRFYRADDEVFKIYHMSNGKPAVEVVIEVPLQKWGVDGLFKGKIDLMVHDLEYGGVWVRDAKWVKTIPGPDERMMSPQNIMYVWALRTLGHDIRGFIYDYGRTKPPTEPYILKSGVVTTRKNIDTDVGTYLAAIKKTHGNKWKSYVRTVYREKLRELLARETLWFDRQRIPVEGERVENGFHEFIAGCKSIINRGDPVRNYLYNCKWNCGYHEPCVAEFQGMDIKRLMRSQFVVEPERYELEEIN